MAQIEQSDGGKKKKGAQKKMHIHVDFTPMVDMNMLLITFFMLCTTMIKSQTLNISLPTNEKLEQTELQKAKESEAITLILDTTYDDRGGIKENTIYYYFGKPEMQIENGEVVSSNLQVEHFVGNEGAMLKGIRKILHDRNKEVLEEVDKQKQLWRDKKITEEEFQKQAKDIRNNDKYTRPVVIIKPMPEASWESVISALDEMQINQISRYQIGTLTEGDEAMVGDYRIKHAK